MIIKVKNKKGTSQKDPPAGYSSWLDFWEKKQGRKAKNCKVISCSGNADVGGHVIKSGEGGTEYIMPLCYSCNNKPDGSEFEAYSHDLERAN